MTQSQTEDRWAVAIGTLFLLKQQISELEDPSLIGFSIARVKATPEQVMAGSASDGPFPPELSEWLLHANGWPGVYFDLSLLPLESFERADTAAAHDGAVESYLDITLADHDGARMIVVGSSLHTVHRVLVVTEDTGGDPAGTVYWCDETSTDRFEDFYEFFLVLIDAHRGRLQSLTSAGTG